MSAWIVEEDHIDMLTTALLNPVISNANVQLDPHGLGHMLWTENHASVNYRYSESTPVPGYAFRVVPELAIPDLEPYHLVILDKQRRCYEYQSCEHPEWEGSTARELMLVLEQGVAHLLAKWPQIKSPLGDWSDLAGADAAPWDWSRENGMPVLDMEQAKRAR